MNYHIKQVLRKSELAGRMVAWSIELLEFDIHYKPRGPHEDIIHGLLSGIICWKRHNHPRVVDPFYVDDVSNIKRYGAGIILEGPDNITLEQALKLNFRASNNQAEYKVLIAGLKLAREVRAKRLRCYTDSQLVQG